MPAVYLLGVTLSDLQLPDGLTGVGGPLRLQAQGAVAAIVSDVDDWFQPQPDDLGCHAAAVDAVFAAGTVLPARFGSVFQSEDDVTRLLRDRQTMYVRHLRRLEGAVELVVTAHHLEDRVLREVAADPRVRRLSAATRSSQGIAGRMELGEAVAAGLERRRQEDASWLFKSLLPFSSAAAQHEFEAGVLRAGFLVASDAVGRFSGRLASIEREAADRIEIDYIGPIPPYSFAEPPELDPGPIWAF